jgi:hypothetical protein
MRRVLLLVLAACGDNHAVPIIDAPAAKVVDASPDAPPIDAPPFVRVYSHVEPHIDLGGTITTLEGPPQATQVDTQWDFYFDVPDGSRLIMRVPSATSDYLPMIRGVVAHDHLRIRNFYMLGADEIAAAEGALGVTFDPAKAILEVDFRNATIGGYGVTLTRAGNPVTPEFGVALDGNDAPQLSQVTVVGGNGSTLLLANLPPGNVSFTPIVPAGATLPCQARDADPLPLVAGTVTWFDYECGNAED